MSTLHERRIDLSCGQNRYLEAGDGPPVLLLHGMGMASSASGFELLIPHLARQFRVLAPDLLGFGLGTRTVEAGPTFELIVEQLRDAQVAVEVDGEEYPNGVFALTHDPEGNPIQLWEPRGVAADAKR